MMDWRKLTTNVLIAYIASWSYFAVTLRIFTTMLGKVHGVFVNYILSWGLMMAIIFILGKLNPQSENAMSTTPLNQ